MLRVERLNLIDALPFARITVWVPADLAAELSRGAVERSPIYDLLRTRPAEATRVITAAAAGRDDARLLGVRRGAPVLVCERITKEASGRAVLLSESVYDPSKTEFVAELSAPAAAGEAELRLVRGDVPVARAARSRARARGAAA